MKKILVLMQWALLIPFLFGSDQKLIPPAPEPGVYRMGPGLSSPKVTHKREPSYTRLALDARVQGECLLDLVIDEKGLPTRVVVLSPLGFGLDERAVEAVSTWRFEPGRKDGVPVKTRAAIQVSFRLLGEFYDQKTEHRRTLFNQVVGRMRQQPDGNATAEQVGRIRALANEKFPAACFILATWELSGRNVAKNESDGLELLKRALLNNYGPALFYWGALQLEGRLLPRDEAAGMKQIREAAVLGSSDAQMMLGKKYELGDGVEKDVSRAKRYFRLCAASGLPYCEYRLAHILLSARDRSENDFLQGVAWLQLAADHGLEEAKQMAESEIGELTEDQKAWISRLKTQLERKTT